MHLHEPPGLADTAPLVEVLQERDRLLLGPVRTEQRRPLALGGPAAAGAALQDPVLLAGAAAAVDAEVVATAPAVVGAVRVQATEACEVIHGRFEPMSLGKRANPTRFQNLQQRVCV
jgi:hypothetical protein